MAFVGAILVSGCASQLRPVAHAVTFDFSRGAPDRALVTAYFAKSAAEEAQARREVGLPTIKPSIGIDHFDVDDDGRDEILVYYNSSFSCGSRGCSFLIFEKKNGRLEPLGWTKNSTSITAYDVGTSILHSETNGLHDVRFNGLNGHIFRWNGKEYE